LPFEVVKEVGKQKNRSCVETLRKKTNPTVKKIRKEKKKEKIRYCVERG
jgi:hypothetical protein